MQIDSFLEKEKIAGLLMVPVRLELNTGKPITKVEIGSRAARQVQWLKLAEAIAVIMTAYPY